MKSSISFKDFAGKTIAYVDDSCRNMITILFTDGSKYDIYADCEPGDYSIPFFEIYDTKDQK